MQSFCFCLCFSIKCTKATISKKCIIIIGGHGFWDKGGVDTGGCLKKNFPAAFGGRKIFRRRRHRGVKIFFRWGVYLVDRGVILPKNPKKWPHRGVKIFFPRGASHPGVHPPLVFFPPGVGQIFGLRGGCTPHTPPPAHLCTQDTKTTLIALGPTLRNIYRKHENHYCE